MAGIEVATGELMDREVLVKIIGKRIADVLNKINDDVRRSCESKYNIPFSYTHFGPKYNDLRDSHE